MDFQELVKISEKQEVESKVVLCEFLQVLFLESLYSDKVAKALFFHGGTSLRLLDGGYRYSEDLDFACTPLDEGQILSLFDRSYKTFQKGVMQNWGRGEFEFKWHHRQFPVLSAWLMVQHPNFRGKLKVKLEIGNYPVRRPEIRVVNVTDYPLAIRPLVSSQNVSETLADKVNAMAQRKYLKARDFFDVWFLTEALKINLDFDLIRQKFLDYQTLRPLPALLDVAEKLDEFDLKSELNRFLPARHRVYLEKDNYQLVRQSTHRCIEQVIANVKTPDAN